MEADLLFRLQNQDAGMRRQRGGGGETRNTAANDQNVGGLGQDASLSWTTLPP